MISHGVSYNLKCLSLYPSAVPFSSLEKRVTDEYSHGCKDHGAYECLDSMMD